MATSTGGEPTKPLAPIGSDAGTMFNYPGFFAAPIEVSRAQKQARDAIVAAVDGGGNPLSDYRQFMFLLNMMEQRSRVFMRGAVLWITIGCPLLVAALWLMGGMLLRAALR